MATVATHCVVCEQLDLVVIVSDAVRVVRRVAVN